MTEKAGPRRRSLPHMIRIVVVEYLQDKSKIYNSTVNFIMSINYGEYDAVQSGRGVAVLQKS